MPHTVLIIEDDERLRSDIVMVLGFEDFRTLAAENGQIGVELAFQQHPDVILCDVMMPEMDGFEVFEALHREPETADIPFIFLTASVERENLEKAHEMGASGFLTKPFTYPDLLEAIRARIGE